MTSAKALIKFNGHLLKNIFISIDAERYGTISDLLENYIVPMCTEIDRGYYQSCSIYIQDYECSGDAPSRTLINQTVIFNFYSGSRQLK